MVIKTNILIIVLSDLIQSKIQKKDLENNSDNVFIKPYREFIRSEDIYKLRSNSHQVFDKIPNITKSNKQFFIDMNNNYFQNSKRPFKSYVES